MIATQEDWLYFTKLNFSAWISVEKASPNFLWFKISKKYTKTTKYIFAIIGMWRLHSTLNCSKIWKANRELFFPRIGSPHG